MLGKQYHDERRDRGVSGRIHTCWKHAGNRGSTAPDTHMLAASTPAPAELHGECRVKGASIAGGLRGDIGSIQSRLPGKQRTFTSAEAMFVVHARSQWQTPLIKTMAYSSSGVCRLRIDNDEAIVVQIHECMLAPTLGVD